MLQTHLKMFKQFFFIKLIIIIVLFRIMPSIINKRSFNHIQPDNNRCLAIIICRIVGGKFQSIYSCIYISNVPTNIS